MQLVLGALFSRGFPIRKCTQNLLTAFNIEICE